MSIEDKVEELVEHYSAYDELHPLLIELSVNNDLTLLINEAIAHENCLIVQRSQNLEKGEITVYQKAFLELCQYANKSPAVALWVEEILGTNAVPPDERISILETAALSRGAILRGTSPLPRDLISRRV